MHRLNFSFANLSLTDLAAALEPPGPSSSAAIVAPPPASPDQQALLEDVLRADDQCLAEDLASPAQRAAARTARFRDGRTLLHVAASTGRPATIAALRDAGIDALRQDDHGVLPLHEALGWRRDMPAALRALIRWRHDHPGDESASAPGRAWLDLVALGTSRLAAAEELLGGGAEEDTALEVSILRLRMEEILPVMDLPGDPTTWQPDLVVGALTLATARRDLPSLRRLLRREQIHGEDAKTAIFVDHVVGRLGRHAEERGPAASFRDDLVKALWYKRYCRPRMRFLGLIPLLLRVDDHPWLRTLARSVKQPPKARAQRYLNAGGNNAPLAILLTEGAPLSLTTYFVQAGAQVEAPADAPEAVAPVLLAAGLRSRWLVALASTLEAVHDGAAECEGRGIDIAGSGVRETFLSHKTCKNLRGFADGLHFEPAAVDFLLTNGASPFAQQTSRQLEQLPGDPPPHNDVRTFTLAELSRRLEQLSGDPLPHDVVRKVSLTELTRPRPCTVTLLDLATMAGEEDTACTILDHAEYQPTPRQECQARRIAATLIAAGAYHGDRRSAALGRIYNRLRASA